MRFMAFISAFNGNPLSLQTKSTVLYFLIAKILNHGVKIASKAIFRRLFLRNSLCIGSLFWSDPIARVTFSCSANEEKRQ